MVMAVAAVFLSGGAIVLGRMLNAGLAGRRGPVLSSLMNYITGLAGSLVMLLFLGGAAHAAFPAPQVSPVMYLGGALGLFCVYLLNVITHRLPAMQLTLLIFIGQLFSGMALDFFSTGLFSPGKLAGGFLVFLGLLISRRGDKRS